MSKKKNKKDKYLPEYQSIKALNLPKYDHGASIHSRIYGKTGTKNPKWDNYKVIIRDCENHVVLHGSLATPEDRSNAVYKLEMIIDELADLISHLDDNDLLS